MAEKNILETNLHVWIIIYIYGLILYRKMRFLFFIWLIGFGGLPASAQTFSKQTLAFTLSDKSGTVYSEEAIKNGTVKIYSLREAKLSKNQNLTFQKATNQFHFSEDIYSPGLSLAFVSPTDTMYLEVYGRSATHRTIDGIKIQKGSYSLTSNDFASGKTVKITHWDTYVTDEVPVKEQNLAEYAQELRNKKPVLLMQTSTTN